MPEIVTHATEEEAMKWPPYRVGFEYKLYYNALTMFYQWINDPWVAKNFGLYRIFPDPEPFNNGFGRSTFGIADFGR